MAAETPSTHTALLKHMRVLSESRGLVWRAYKNHIMIGLKNPYKDPKVRLSQASHAFEKSMNVSRDYATQNDLTKMLPFLNQADKEWVTLKGMLFDTPLPKQVAAIDTLAMKLTRTIIKALKAMGSYDSSGEWQYLEQTQKAQNIAQRLATLYLDNVWGSLDPKRYDKMMKKTTNAYLKVENLIYKSHFLTPEIEQSLKKAHRAYLYFALMWQSGKHISIPTLIYKKSSDMDAILGHCTDLIVEQISP